MSTFSVSSDSIAPKKNAAFIFCSPYPGTFTIVSLIIDVSLTFFVLLSTVAIIIESDLEGSSKVLPSVPIKSILVKSLVNPKELK